MLGLLFSFFQWLWGFWDELPPEVKKKVIEKIVQTMDSFFRAFYHANKKEESNGNA